MGQIFMAFSEYLNFKAEMSSPTHSLLYGLILEAYLVAAPEHLKTLELSLGTIHILRQHVFGLFGPHPLTHKLPILRRHSIWTAPITPCQQISTFC